MTSGIRSLPQIQRLRFGTNVLKQRLSLGKFFGIRLYVHWSFTLLLAYAAFQVRDAGLVGMAFVIGIVLSLFVCVTLHEYGHALAARRFGIPTVDITLLPIGGVARLERMPRIPWQELVVAVAGPAVNVVIATLIGIGLFLAEGEDLFVALFTDAGSAVVESTDLVTEADAVTTPAQAREAAEKAEALAVDESLEALKNPDFLQFTVIMFMANTVLVIFNMIPAFPMDGGRVLRSLLAMFLDYRKATFIASRIGLVCAAGMVLWFFQSGQESVTLLLIAGFVCYAGLAEWRQVDVSESLRGLFVRDAMVHAPPSVSMDTPLETVASYWRDLSTTALPVISYAGTVVGLLKLTDVSKAVDSGLAPQTTAGSLADHGLPTIHPDSSLEDAVMSLKREQRQVPVVDTENRLVGLLDLDLIRSRAPLMKMAARSNDLDTPAQDNVDSVPQG